MPTTQTATARSVVIIGAGGHGRVAAEALAAAGGAVLHGFLDGNVELTGQTVAGSRVIGDEATLPQLLKAGVRSFHIGVGSAGDTRPRRRLYEAGAGAGLEPLTIVHPSAWIAPSAEVGSGSIVLPGAIVHTKARIGKNVIVNTGSIVEHDCVIGDHCHIAPGVVLSGNTKVGEGAHVGAGATVIQGISIGADSVVAAGAVVVEDVPPRAMVAGVPASIRKLRQLST